MESCSSIINLWLIVRAGTALADGDKTKKFKPFYVKASAGYEMITIKMSRDNNSGTEKGNGRTGRFSVGYHFTENFATELDLGIYYTKIDTTENTMYSIFANCQYDFVPTSQFSPYIKAGLGYQHLMISLQSVHMRNVNLPTAAVGVGVIYNISNNIFLDIGYTFSMSMKSKIKLASGIDSGEKASLTAHNIVIGAGFRFKSLHFFKLFSFQSKQS